MKKFTVSTGLLVKVGAVLALALALTGCPQEAEETLDGTWKYESADKSTSIELIVSGDTLVLTTILGQSVYARRGTFTDTGAEIILTVTRVYDQSKADPSKGEWLDLADYVNVQLERDKATAELSIETLGQDWYDKELERLKTYWDNKHKELSEEIIRYARDGNTLSLLWPHEIEPKVLTKQ